MAQDNPSNPFTQDPNHTSKDVQMPISKARVVSAKGHPEKNGFHSVRIRVYSDEATYLAPVVTPVPGSVWVPKKGTDVAVLFNQSGKPWVIGSWYALDRVEEGDVSLPEYTPGDVRIGNHTGSHVTVYNDGSIGVQTDDTQPVNIDHHSGVAKMSTDQTISGDDTYTRVNFDTHEDDPDDLFTETTNSFTIQSSGTHNVLSTVEIQEAGQNNRYTIALFQNGELFKRKSRQSSQNDILSLDVRTTRNLDANDVIDVRLRQDSGATKTINSSFKATEFSIQRHGI